MSDITVVIPSIPTRDTLLLRALESVQTQTLSPASVIVEIDTERTGAPATRNRGLEQVETEWVAFLDDDDYFLENHLEVLRGLAESTDADVIYTGCNVTDGYGRVMPRREEWGRFGHEFDPDLLRKKSYIPVTCLARTSLAKSVGGFSYPDGAEYEDWGFYLKMLDAGAKFHHEPIVTWIWEHRIGIQYPYDGTHNTSGQADNW